MDGLPVGIASTDASLTQSFDQFNRLKTVVSNHVPGTLTNTYNTRGLRSNMNYVVGNGAIINVNYFYDERRLPVRMEATLAGHKITWERFWDELGRPETDILSNGMRVERRYDGAGRLVYLSNELDSNPISRFEYSYNPTGTINRMIKSFTRPEQSDVGRYEFVFGYDNADRLVSSSFEGAFSYDEVGNHLQRGGQHNEINHLIEDSEYTYTYTTNGNQGVKISKLTGERIEYTWDNENKLVQSIVKSSSGVIKSSVHHKYDGLGRRIEKIVNGNRTAYAYDNEDIVVEFKDNGTIEAIYLHGPGIDEPIAMVRDVNGDGEFSDQEVFFYTKDHLNSVHSLTDKSGKPVQRYNYTVYGGTKVEKTNPADRLIKNPYGYTSREWEEETGDYYYRARYYDPQAGRFMSPDPIGFAGGDTNLYRYVKNQPLIYTDPTGNFFLPGAIVGGIIGGLSGAAGAIIQGGTYGQIAASVAIGAFAGGWVGSGTGIIAGALINGGANITGQVISGADSVSKINFTSAAISGVAGASAAALGALTGTSVSGAFGGSLAASSLDILAAAVGISPNSSGNSSSAAPVGGMCGGGQ